MILPHIKCPDTISSCLNYMFFPLRWKINVGNGCQSCGREKQWSEWNILFKKNKKEIFKTSIPTM